jgi:hypothetical protein
VVLVKCKDNEILLVPAINYGDYNKKLTDEIYQVLKRFNDTENNQKRSDCNAKTQPLKKRHQRKFHTQGATLYL